MKNIIALVISTIAGVFVFSSCSDPYSEVIELEKFMYISLSGAADNPIIKTVDLDENATFPLSISYGGTTNYEQGEIIAQIAMDNSLVAAYNTEHNTSYLPLPDGAVTLDKTTLTITDGSRVSDQLNITIQPHRANFVNEYLLPVTIQSATEGKIPVSEEFKTVYYVIKGNVETLPLEEKWTVLDASSVWQPTFPVESIWDGDRNTYWHTDLSGMPQWFAVNMNEYKLIEGFTWVNRQDEAEAVPKHVKFETSMNGTDWTEVLDLPEIPKSNLMQIFELPEKVIARYFRVTILSNWANAPYSYVADVSTWAGEKPTGDYDWEKNTWEVIDYRSQWNDGWAVSKIFDGDKSTTWHSDPFNGELNGMPQWFIVDMKKPRPAIKGFLIWQRQDDHGMEPKHVVFSVSQDNTEWTQVLEVTDMSNDFSKELDYKTTNPAPGRYLKVEIKSIWGTNPWTYFGEITPY
ncbi:discoidin domain-containing protein [uncultured Proteiniphilum sp.]|uniref:discoidin domain-containing protein n=1 Tax=uncultured Proteiniphilum sp. TaxID=497637 RepID=UPI0026317DD5|nr:discoidin domain-containing protein [uncultured Proteiniphilum sp.]